MNILDTFRIGMDRPLAEFKEPTAKGLIFNVGAGKKMIEGATPLDLPAWYGGHDPLPCADGSVSQIYAFHFLEHLGKRELIFCLRDFERALMVGGLVNIVVPHWSGEMAWADFDHKTAWSETSLRQLFHNTYYDGSMAQARNWKFQINAVLLAGVVQRNLAVLAQIERTA